MDPTYTHKQQNIEKKKKKELDFLLRLGDGTHLLPEATKQKEKKGSRPLSKVGSDTDQN